MKKRILQMKWTKRIVLIALLLSAVGMGKMYAYDFSAVCETGQTLYYNITDAENHYVAMVCPGQADYSNCWSGFTKPTGDIVLPENVQYEGNTYAVTSIGDYAFFNCSSLTGSLTIPNSVTIIGEFAFFGCSGFTSSLTIGNSVTTIGNNAFNNCSGFTGNLTIPNSLTSIGEGAFYGCSGFTGNLILGNSVTTIGIDAFRDCSGFTGDLIIPNSVTTIGIDAFCDCSSFTGDLVIPNTVTEIGSSTFYGCEGFTGELIIPNSVTSIGNFAFSSCSGFTGSLAIPSSVTTIGDYAFESCDGFIGDLIIPNSVISIGEGAFSFCYGFNGNLIIPNSVATIGSYAFSYCNGIISIKCLSETPPALSVGAFLNLNSSIPIYVPCGFEESYSSMSWGGFSNFYGLCGGIVAVIAAPEEGGMVMGGGSFDAGQICTVSAIANEGYIFYNWTINGTMVSNKAEYTFYVVDDVTLVALFIPDDNIVFVDTIVKEICVSHWDTNSDGELSYAEAASVRSLGSYFRYNEQITSFEELQYFIGLSSIDNQAFSYCNGLMGNLIIPNSVTEIGQSAFNDCTGLTGNLTIPNSVTMIGENAFHGCSGFTGSLTIGNSVTTIGDLAFFGCSGLTGSLTIPNSVTTIGSDAFYNCSGLTGSLTIPNSVTTIGSYAFSSCSGFTGNLTIGNSVTTIGNGAFSNCSGLTGSLTIGNSVTTIGNSAFYNCSGLTEIMMLGTTPPSLGSSAFFNTNNCPIYVPYESLNNYKTATNWSSYQSRIFPWLQKDVEGYGEDAGGWRFIASPCVANIAPTAVDDMITETAYDLYRFDQNEELEWRNYEDSENTQDFMLVNGQGYLYANEEDVNLVFKGNFNEDETKEVDLVYDADASFAGWNLVGNPFPVSAYASRSYYTMNEEGTAIEPNMVSSATAIPACTGVMVMAETEGETAVFSTEAPEAATNQGCLQIELSHAVELVETPTRKQDGPSTGSVTALDKAIVSFNAGDRLEKFVFNKENAVISIPQGGKELAIACSDKQGEMPLNFKASKNGEYTLTIHPEAVELEYLHLIDNLTGADVDLLALQQAQGPANYTFEAKTTDYASRFRLVFSGKEADGPSSGSETFAFVNNGNIIITGAEAGAKLQIVDMTGRVVASCGGHTRCVPTTGMAKGVYVLRLINGDDVKTQKIVIR